ncbi:PRC-barrel domain-containing protein [Paracoccus rhizosphaerae]|uniref:PRC-barrel domain-containing protein n=1 Tax=Paracoccus rhizosphaerae TaxID=1133347 RepID=A0ABV6CTI6_9RHOB|nr:PRC-barrel domain-containing protein [Paracoccus rhizosphaerae]
MRKLLLTTAFALPVAFAAQAQDAATDPATETGTMETAPMATDATTDPTAEMPAADMEASEDAAAASAAEKVEQQQAANEWRVDWITGTTVTSPDGENIGSISDLIVDGDTGQMKAAVIGVGGFLGIGEKQIALPWEELTINSDAQEITSDLTKEEADAAPEYVFREQEQPAGEMMTDPAAGTTAPAADPMATGGMGATTAPAMDATTDPAATEIMEEPADSGDMQTETMETETETMEAQPVETMEAEPADATEAEPMEETTETAPAN